MNTPLQLRTLLSGTRAKPADRLQIFAVIAVGVVESLADGAMSADDATRDFFNAENCLFVERRLKGKAASQIMARGVQLADLFETLSPEAAHREYQRELESLRSLGLKLLKPKRRVA